MGLVLLILSLIKIGEKFSGLFVSLWRVFFSEAYEVLLNSVFLLFDLFI